MSEVTADGSRGASLAADTLSAALAAIVLSWSLGLEQIVPGLILLVGCWRLWRLGELRWAGELWPFVLLGLWSLTSASALEGGASWLIYARGEVHLVVAVAAYLVAVSIEPASASFGRFLKLCVVVVGIVMTCSLLVVSHVVPLQFSSALGLLAPAFETSSTFVDDFILNRQLGTERGVSLFKDIKRQSSFFLYQGGLTTVFLLLESWLLLARRRLTGAWRVAATGGVAAVLGLVPLTGSRSGVVLCWGVVAAIALWSAIADKPWRRLAVRLVAGLLLIFGLVAVIPIGDGSSLEHGALWERAVTSFRVKSFIDRFEVYTETVERLNERPLTGWAIQERPSESRRYLRLGTHSEVLNVAYRFGWVGLGLLLATAGLYLRRLTIHSARGGGRLSPEHPILVAALLAVGATALIRTFQWDLNVLWLVAAFLGSTRAVLAPSSSVRESAAAGLSFSMLGADLRALTIDDLHREMGRAVEQRRRLVIGHQNLHGLYLLPRERGMQEFAGVADVVFIDGMALVYMARCLGHGLRREHRVTYADWLEPLAGECVRQGWRVFHLGGRAGVGERARASLLESHPGLEMETLPGYFEAADNEGILRSIAGFEPDVLMVGMGMPRQEAWVAQNLDKIGANVILTCGACMDYVAGVVSTPPRWTGRVGLEWLFRLAAEPRRLWRRYLVEPWSVLRRFVTEWCARRRDRPT